MLKERWTLIQAGHDRKAIKINSRNCTLYLNIKAYGKIVNSQFQHFAYSPPNLTTKTMDVQEPLISLANPPSQSVTTAHGQSDQPK